MPDITSHATHDLGPNVVGKTRVEVVPGGFEAENRVENRFRQTEETGGITGEDEVHEVKCETVAADFIRSSKGNQQQAKSAHNM